ncbi:hypothetical protein HHUSO_G19991 [Huso huso]|uniref:C2H2-type domain-containing protein n=1 Tax=Huso huso TaxID=61971 RepID=A0ABR0Z377_HUSHU
MRWLCKICSFVTSRKTELLKHYRLRHGHSQSLPCLYTNCLCSFKTWSALKSHLSRQHATDQSVRPGEVLSFKCEICNSCSFSTEKNYFEHLGIHLKKHETLVCVFEKCNFSTNVYGTFASHRSRKHNPHSLEDFRTGILQKYVDQANTQDDVVVHEEENSCECLEDESEELENVMVQKIGHHLLKLESIFNVSNKCINEVVEELQFISCSVSSPVIRDIVNSCLKKHDCVVDDSVISDLVKEVCESNPISSALKADGHLATPYKRREFFKKTFSLIEPVEYILDAKDGRTFQYVPILQSRGIFRRKLSSPPKLLYSQTTCGSQYESFRDGTHFKENECLSTDELTVSLLLYVDDFEVCNPLGTSRKKHKITAVYWVLADVPSQFRSTLTSIYLAILCKAADVKRYGYGAVLEPLLKDLVKLEEEGLFIPVLGKSIKGTVFGVAADNLGAHSIGGFVESFSGSHICRFYLGKHSDFQEKEVRTGAFQPRTKQEHSIHVQTALENPNLPHCFGVKKQCALTEKLKYFHVLSGYPPDLLHDLFEGIEPLELALCLNILIKKKYFTVFELNNLIRQFPYKWSDKTNCPQSVPLNLATRRTVGGNAHENWCLLHLLPFIIGTNIPVGEPSWQVLMDLKDIVELVVSPLHTEETIWYLDAKISEHRRRFLEVFPQEKLIPKHHFLEHYPQLIKAFGPLVALWTMRFEAKHSFFKRVVRQTNNFRNILQSLAVKHQLMLAYHLYSTDVVKPALSVTKLSTVALEVLKEDIQEAVQRKFPDETCVHLANTVSSYGTDYLVGMILAHGSTGGLPDFVELLLMIIVHGKLAFVVKCQNAWYNEHLRGFELDSTGNVQVLEQQELSDIYPLAAYTVGQNRMVTLKRHIFLPY